MGAASISDLAAFGMNVLPEGDFVVADLEYTAWEGSLARGWGGPGEFREIVQIGAVRVSRASGLTEAAALSLLVRPTLNPVLSDYFIALTRITDADLAREGVGLSEALDAFAAFTQGLPVLTHGPDDQIIVAECRKKDLANPMGQATWIDIRPPLQEITGLALMSSELPAQFGLPETGRAHNALEDSRALVQVLAHLQATDALGG